MRKYVDLWKDDVAGQTHVTEHAIELTTTRLIIIEKAIIDHEIEDMLQKNVIRPSHSPYQEKTEDILFCLDFCQLNRNEGTSKTAFLSYRRSYEFTVMLSGLVNAPATFQRVVDRLFGDFSYDGDDILVHATTEEKMSELLDTELLTAMVLEQLLNLSVILFNDDCIPNIERR
eukprot:Blabericola_migrator_1__9234@NODE_4959_length_919_cov_3_313380_g3112_i0_p1_GENE_NODE_4959_length_919_cov_3_313380_g3112_i0NODE_4959_length_919_cov_3_313380_g3112_i0_p1_ORF_typecomplete_len173_score22_28RVT_1/PF00078_27/0_011_NODE_4959_length_919_cov_3_313380_g3112_i0295813